MNVYIISTYADTLIKYYYSSTEWAVFLKNDSVKAINSKDFEAPHLPFQIKRNKIEKNELFGKLSILKVEDGYLVGSYRGEWGGELYWFSLDGKKHYKISDDEIVQFIKKDGENYAIQGLAHLSISEGSIIDIEKVKNRWIRKEYLKLPTAPDGIALDSRNNFIVITSKSLFKINAKMEIDTLVERGIWYDKLYTNSIIVKDDIIYAGMRAGIYKYNLQTNEQNWLKPD